MIVELTNSELKLCSGGMCTNQALSIVSTCLGFASATSVAICGYVLIYNKQILSDNPKALSAATATITLVSSILTAVFSLATSVVSAVGAAYPTCTAPAINSTATPT